MKGNDQQWSGKSRLNLVSMGGVYKPQVVGCMRPRMAMNAAQCETINWLKTFFCLSVFNSGFVFNLDQDNSSSSNVAQRCWDPWIEWHALCLGLCFQAWGDFGQENDLVTTLLREELLGRRMDLDQRREGLDIVNPKLSCRWLCWFHFVRQEMKLQGIRHSNFLNWLQGLSPRWPTPQTNGSLKSCCFYCFQACAYKKVGKLSLE